MEKIKEAFSKNSILVWGIIFVAFNLRTPLAYVSPLVNNIRLDLSISNAGIGFLMTLPLLLFAFLSPVATKLGSWLGNELSIFIGLIVITIGELIRPLGEANMLFLGTALIGIGIAVGNVLVPSIIKHKFPAKIGLMTSIYTTSSTVLAAVGSGISEPIANSLHFGWRNSIMILGGLTLVTIVIWLPQLYNTRNYPCAKKTAVSKTAIWSSALAWQVSIFLGLQSCLIFSLVAWLPEILRGFGLNASSAGWLFSYFQLVSMPTSFIAPIIAVRFKDQRGITIIFSLITLLGAVGLLIGGSVVALTIWLTLLAAGVGACLSLAFTFIGLRTTDKLQAAELSGMSQFVGYLLAAVGPSLIGFLYDYTRSWTVPIMLFVVISVAMCFLGIGAGRNRYIIEQEV